MKDGSDLTLADNMTLSDNNRVLTFNIVKRKDKGEYFCDISNPISSDRAKYVMVVNYGPENVQIEGPKKINIKGTLTLTCSADSTPSARFTWFFNGTEITRNSAEYIKEEVKLSDSGNYTCQAWNNVTDRTSSSVVHALTVTDKPSPCAAGCIAGIVIACCVIIAAAVGGGYYIYKRKYELNYADIKFFPNRNGGRVQTGLENDSTDYAHVQMNSRALAASTLPTYDTHMNRAKRPAPQPETNGAQIYSQIRKH
ncbi:carcinoembryonic antigen-related cell adhesion molecule 20-like [Archocentrus centrarchus]|uniref:carcinoembryonic antigen-related cell adhesion molecule 20-like n=1 Tax=Archocentrus centrarchus TaxID=63155 RepID=UPI0011EA17AC|nr:carcinoembryonic antigen-related cell adhesion molecule 20-like [Archocentrus centrarchus]